MKKIIISETLLQELLIRQNNTGHNSAISRVYLGDKWVKKYYKWDNKYPQYEIMQYRVMAKYPNIFPETKIKKLKNNIKILILQKKVDVHGAGVIWNKLDEIFQLIRINHQISFRTFLEYVAQDGLTSSLKEFYETIKERMYNYRIGEKEIKRFDEFVNLSINLHKIQSKYKTLMKYESDLHDENYGLDENGNLKIIDFISRVER